VTLVACVVILKIKKEYPSNKQEYILKTDHIDCYTISYADIILEFGNLQNSQGTYTDDNIAPFKVLIK
jgi:hypothetical protein